MKRLPTLGALFGTAAALGVLAWLSFVLLNSDGANYKVLVAVWLWLLPAVGVGAGLGYAVGKIVEAVTGAKSSDQEGGARANAAGKSARRSNGSWTVSNTGSRRHSGLYRPRRTLRPRGDRRRHRDLHLRARGAREVLLLSRFVVLMFVSWLFVGCGSGGAKSPSVLHAPAGVSLRVERVVSADFPAAFAFNPVDGQLWYGELQNGRIFSSGKQRWDFAVSTGGESGLESMTISADGRSRGLSFGPERRPARSEGGRR